MTKCCVEGCGEAYHLLLHRRAQALGYEPPGGFKKAKKQKSTGCDLSAEGE